MKLAASLLGCVALIALGAQASAAKKEKDKDAGAAARPALVGSYGDWKVYHSGAGKSKICYLLAEPKSRDPDDDSKAYAFISERPAEHVRNELSFVMGFDVAAPGDVKKEKEKPKRHERKAKKSEAADEEADALAPTAVIGDAAFDLAPKGNDLWVKNAPDEAKVIDEMRKGASLVIKAASKRGKVTTDTYSLSGFSQAVDKALKDCAATS